jgi:hypothetical protein
MSNENNYKKYFEDIKKSEKMFKEILKLYPSKVPKPINLEDEKRIFFNKFKKNQKYNPQIDYSLKKYVMRDFYMLRFKLSYLIHIEEDQKDEMGIKTLYKQKLKELSNKINYHDLWGELKSVKYVLKTYGEPNFFTCVRARWFCRVNKYSRKKFSLKLKDNVNKLRVINSKKTKIKLFEVGTAKSYETQIGLELYDEFINNKLGDEDLFYYAGMYIASYYTLRKGFYGVFKILKRYNFTGEEAFDMTYEVKKNLFDTSLKGGFVKSSLSYSGFLKVKKFAKNNNLDDLMFGCVGIDDLKILEKYRLTLNQEKILK